MVSAYDGPGSGSSRECAEKTVTSPTFAPDASWPMPRRSTTVTRRPALARSYAAPVPIAPAPITTTSVAGNLIDRSRQEALLVAQLEPRIERVPEPVAERARRLHEVPLLEREDRPAHDARVDHPAGDAEDDDDRAEPAADGRDDGDGEQIEGERDLDVGEEEDHPLGDAAVEAGEQAE